MATSDKIDIWVLTGFLGSGKTSTVNKLINSEFFAGSELSLIINEFSRVGIDADLIDPGDYRKYDLNKGSVFCVCTKTSFIKILSDIAEKQTAGSVIIESTGVADICDMDAVLNTPSLSGRFNIKGYICLVDADKYIRTAAFLKSAISQVRFSDAIVINKIDTVSDYHLDRLEDILRQVNSVAPICRTTFGSIECEFLEGITHSEIKAEASASLPVRMPAASFKASGPINRQRFMDTIKRLGNVILRLKGNVMFEDEHCFVEYVFNDQIIIPAKEAVGQGTVFSVIGWNTTVQHLREEFDMCISSSDCKC